MVLFGGGGGGGGGGGCSCFSRGKYFLRDFGGVVSFGIERIMLRRSHSTLSPMGVVSGRDLAWLWTLTSLWAMTSSILHLYPSAA